MSLYSDPPILLKLKSNDPWVQVVFGWPACRLCSSSGIRFSRLSLHYLGKGVRSSPPFRALNFLLTHSETGPSVCSLSSSPWHGPVLKQGPTDIAVGWEVSALLDTLVFTLTLMRTIKLRKVHGMSISLTGEGLIDILLRDGKLTNPHKLKKTYH